jgi:hypothetical protein
MRRTTINALRIALVSSILISCAPAPKFQLIESLSSTPPAAGIALYIEEEVDIVGDYSSRIVLYGLPSLRGELQRRLSQPQLKHTLGEVNGYVRNVDNPFSIVSDSTEAHAIISIVVEGFGYGKGNELTRLVQNSAIFGWLGAALTNTDPQGYVVASCIAREVGTGIILQSFDAVATSSPNLPIRSALEDALLKGVKQAVDDMLTYVE